MNARNRLAQGRYKAAHFLLAAALALGAALLVLALTRTARAAGPTCTVCPGGGCDYTNIQAAVDDAGCTEIKVAEGVYTGVQTRPVPLGYVKPAATLLITQVVYISRTVAIQGGYTTTNWTTPYPLTQPTTLDAGGLGRAIVIAGNIAPTVEGLGLTNGRAAGLGGDPEGDAGGGGYVISATATISNCRVFSNTSPVYGGGLALRYSASTLIANSVFSNSTGFGSGGVDLYASPATLIANSVISNVASRFGGGMYLYFSDARLTNNVIADNQAGTEGSGLYLNGASPRLVHTTIAHNTGGDGSGIFLFGDRTIWLTNTILVSQTTGIFLLRDNRAIMSNTLWYGNAANWGGAGTFTHTGDYTGTPAFVDPDRGDYHIGLGSAAIDRGVNAGVTTDKDGRPRDTNPDLGAYERQPGRLYVDADAVGGAGTGLNWTDAFTQVQTALAVAIPGDEVWVAEGVYRPDYDPGSGTHTGHVTATFVLTDGVALYGGFDPSLGADDFAERDWEAHVTVLSGDLGGDDGSDAHGVVTDTARIVGANAQTVVIGSGVTETAVLDGFTITAGNADGSESDCDWNEPCRSGGGMFNEGSSLTLANVTFSGNAAEYGGGMVNEGGSPALTNVTFSGNTAQGDGGGIYNNWSNSTLTNVTFSGNHANGYGGGMYNFAGSPTLADVTFSGNRAETGGGMYNREESMPTLANVTFSGNAVGNRGGGMFNEWSSPTLANVTFSGNTAGNRGGGMYNRQGSIPTLANCILWGNSATEGGQIYNFGSSSSTISYSLVQGGCPSGSTCDHLLDADPLFVRNPDPGDGDWSTPGDNDYGDLRLRLPSLAIDAGNNGAVPADALDLDGDGDTGEPIPYDLGGDPRFFDVPSVPDTGSGTPPIVDMGAYERQLGSAPVASGDTYATPEDTLLTVVAPGVLSNDGDAENDALVVALESGPSHGALTLNAGGSFSYTPALDYNGVDTFTYDLSDSIFTATATVTITVTPVNDAPVIAEGATISVTMDEDGAPTPFALTLHAGDVDTAGSALAWSVLTPAGHGTASASGTGSSKAIGYAPDADYNGSDLFVVQVGDGGLTDAITVAVTIAPVNDPPTISAIPDQAGRQNSAVGPVPFTVGDVDDPVAGLTLSAATSDAAILPVGNVAFGGAGADRTVTVTPLLEGTVVVTVTVSDGSAMDFSTFTLTVGKHVVYLPLVCNAYTVAPDLVVERIVATATGVQVVIANRGNAPAVDDFWVDAYVAPRTPPTAVNQTWDVVGSQGLAWGVTADLAPGEVLTLSVGGDYYVAAYSAVAWPLPVGTPVYAQVDAVNTETTYGAVLEDHEMTGGAYNNVAGPVSSTAGDGAGVPAVVPGSRPIHLADLPRRK
jgi:VCBS repeat-containing protein